MAELIKVDPQETLDGLLAEIGRRLDSTTSGTLLLWAPRGTALLRQMEDYQALREALRRGGTRLKILSPDARIVGMALVFGLEAEIALYPPDGPALAQAPELLRPPVAWAHAPLAPAGPATPWLGIPAAPAPAAAPDSAELFGGSEAAWLFSGGVDLPALLAEEDPARSRSTTPPPDVLASLPAVAAAASGPAAGAEPALPPAPPPEAAYLAAPLASATANWLHLDEDDAPAVSFPQWVAMQAAAGSGAPPADLDLSHLPAWLQETLAAKPPAAAVPPPVRKPFQPAPAPPGGALVPVAPLGRPPPPRRPPPAVPGGAPLAPAPPSQPPGPRSAVLRCPHCGQELDKEEMLRLLAEVWGQ